MPRKVVIAANSSWNIANFRGGLVRGLRDAGYEPVALAPEDPGSVERMDALGIERIDIRMERSGMNPVADLRLLRDYREALARLKPAAFLGFTIKPNIYGSMAASGLGIPAIPNVSGLGTAFIRRGPLEWVVTRLYRRAFAQVPFVYFQNPDDRQLFVTRRIVDSEQTRLLPGSGVDLDHFAPVEPVKGSPIFLQISRMLRDKGVFEFVEAARELRPQLKGARFQLLGPVDEGNRTAIPRVMIDGWVAEGLVEYLGQTDDVRPFIAKASAVVLASYREGLPRTLLEAGAMARPLISTHVPGCREVIEDGVNGWLCRPGDPESLAMAMRKFADLPAKSKAAMGEASRHKVQERFSEKVVVRAYVDALSRLARD